MSRATSILERFPAHLEAARPGKRIGEVAEALARPLDLLAADLAAVRRSHRPGEADELIDLLRIAALHGLAGADFAPLLLRLQAAGEDGYRVRLEALRIRLLEAIRIARLGQGTVRALLEGAASALGLTLADPARIEHSRHRFWHAAYANDALAPLLAPAGAPFTPPEPEVLGLEENPLRRESTGAQARRHGETWTVRRRGFGAVHLDVAFRGREGGRSMAPMLVQRDQGFGIGFTAPVPAGSVLTFTDGGEVLLDGEDVSGLAYAWIGACFAGADASAERDFVFAPDEPTVPEPPRVAHFARALAVEEDDPLAPDAAFPLAPRPLATPEVSVGETRFACFVQVAHFSALTEPGPTGRRVAPRTAIGFFDGSVFGGEGEPAADVELSWLEHEAYAVRLLVPSRYAALAGDAEKSSATIAAALERSRPAGVDLRVEFFDDALVLDESVLPEGPGSGALAELWARNALAGGGSPGPNP